MDADETTPTPAPGAGDSEGRRGSRETDQVRVMRIAQVVGFDIDVAGSTRNWRSPEYLQLHGLPPSAHVETRADWYRRVHPDDREHADRALVDALKGQSLFYESTYRIVRPVDGEVRWIRARADIERDLAGRAIRLIGAHVDVTSLKQAEEAWRQSEARQRVLIGELQHRSANLMGMIHALAEKTARSSTDLDEFRRRFADSMTVLVRVQSLLSRGDGQQSITFDELIRSELTAIGATDARVTAVGPSGVVLRASSVQTLAMALHELGTNATKYGALSQDTARLAVRWSVGAFDDADGPAWLHVDWCETGVVMPPVTAPARGGGRGRTLIERSLPAQLGAMTTYVLGADGVRCTIALPLVAPGTAGGTGGARGAASTAAPAAVDDATSRIAASGPPAGEPTTS